MSMKPKPPENTLNGAGAFPWSCRPLLRRWNLENGKATTPRRSPRVADEIRYFVKVISPRKVSFRRVIASALAARDSQLYVFANEQGSFDSRLLLPEEIPRERGAEVRGRGVTLIVVASTSKLPVSSSSSLLPHKVAFVSSMRILCFNWKNIYARNFYSAKKILLPNYCVGHSNIFSSCEINCLMFFIVLESESTLVFFTTEIVLSRIIFLFYSTRMIDF